MEPGFKLLREFATDTMKFVLAMNGYSYDGLFEVRDEWVPDTFEYLFGQAVYYYRESHKERFEEMILSYHDLIFHSETKLLEYIKFGIQQFTKGDSLLMDLLRIVAFYSDLILYCQRFDDCEAYTELVAKHFQEIYDYAGIKDVLKVSGSYEFLSRVAEEIIGPRVNEEPFAAQVIRYRRQLRHGSPDRRRVRFALPEEGASSTGRLASCLGMFTNLNENNSDENGFEESNLSESKAGTSNVHLNVPSTSGASVRVTSSTESEEEESGSISERTPCSKESTSGFKKPQSILKSPHKVKGHKRTASDENASTKIKRTRTCSGELAERTESCAEEKDEDSKNPPQEILIHISDSISEELKASLDKLLEEILNYNKTNKEPVVYDVHSESSETSPELSEEPMETEDQNTPISDPVQSSEVSEVFETSVSKLDSLKLVADDDSVCQYDVSKDIQANINEIKNDAEGTETGVSKPDDSLQVMSIDSQSPDLDRDTQNESSKMDTGFNSSPRTKNTETTLKLHEEHQQTSTENLNTNIKGSGETSEVKISSTESDEAEDNQTEFIEAKIDSDSCDKPSEDSTNVSELENSLKIVTIVDFVCKSVVSKIVQDEVKMVSVDCTTSSKDSETGVSKPDKELKIVTIVDSVGKSVFSKIVQDEIKMGSVDCSMSSKDPETGVSKPDKELKIVLSGDSHCSASSGVSNSKKQCAEMDTDFDDSVRTENPEVSLKLSEVPMQTETGNPSALITYTGDSTEITGVQDSSAKSSVPEDNQTKFSETKIDPDDCIKGSETINKCDDSLKIAISGDSSSSDLNKDSNLENRSVRRDAATDVFVHSEPKFSEESKETEAENRNSPITDPGDSGETSGIKNIPDKPGCFDSRTKHSSVE